MLHISIIAIGFAFLMFFSLRSFFKVRSKGFGIEEAIPLTSFGVGVFGLGVAIGSSFGMFGGMQDVVMIGCCWFSIINSLIACHYAVVGHELRLRSRKDDN